MIEIARLNKNNERNLVLEGGLRSIGLESAGENHNIG